MQHDVFLSYSREDVAIMQKVRDELRADGFAVWTDEGIEPGTPSWKVEIEEALLNTTSVVVLLSPSASQSKWVRNELDFAETHRKRIFPMMVRGDEADSVPFGFTTYQWIDIREKKQFESGLTRLKTTLHKAKGEPVPESPTTHQLAESNTTSKFSPLMLAVTGIIVIAIIGVLSYFAFFTPENPGNLTTEVTDEPLITVTNTALPTEAPATGVIDEPPIESPDTDDIPDGWKLVETERGSLIMPVMWLVGDATSPAFESALPIIFGSRSLDTLISPVSIIDTVGGAVTNEGFTGAIIMYDLIDNEDFAPTTDFVISVAEQYIIDYGRLISSEVATIPAGEAHRFHAEITGESDSDGVWQLIGYAIVHENSNGRSQSADYIFFTVLANNYDTMLPTIEQIVDSWQLDN